MSVSGRHCLKSKVSQSNIDGLTRRSGLVFLTPSVFCSPVFLFLRDVTIHQGNSSSPLSLRRYRSIREARGVLWPERRGI